MSNADGRDVDGASSYSLDALESVKRHPEWFFRSGRFDAEELISLLVEEATRGGASAVDVRKHGGWVTVSADVDWLRGDVAAFFAPMSYPEGGRNSSRVEVVLTVFCEAVVTFDPNGGVFEVKSAPEVFRHTVELPPVTLPEGRAIVFLLPAESRRESSSPSSAAGSTSRPALRLVQGEGEDRIIAAVRSFIEKQQHD